MTYQPTKWEKGDDITADKLNRLENGVANVVASGGSVESKPTMPTVYLDGDLPVDKKTKPTMRFKYVDADQEVAGFAKVAVQGDSSSLYAKKNFKLSAFSDDQLTNPLPFQPITTWSPDNVYTAKANYIDATQARNLTSAKLVGDVAKDRQPMIGFNKAFSTNNVGFIPKFSDTMVLAYKVGWDVLAGKKAFISFDLKAPMKDSHEFYVDIQGADITLGPFQTPVFDSQHYFMTFDVPATYTDLKASVAIRVTNKDFDVQSEVKNFMISLGDKDINPKTAYGNFFRSPNQGQVEGTPIQIIVNGAFHGLYTLNSGSNSRTVYGVANDDPKAFAVYTGDMGDDGNMKTPSVAIDGDKFGLLFPETVEQRHTDAFNRFRDFVVNSADSVFATQAPNYFDVQSVIDNLIFSDVMGLGDVANKSQTYMSYDGITFVVSLYDMDQVLGQYWTDMPGTALNGAGLNTKTQNLGRQSDMWGEYVSNLLYKRVYANFKAQIKTRYAQLRNGVLSRANIVNEYKRFINQIPADVYAADHAKWNIPNAEINNIGFIAGFLTDRLRFVDGLYGYAG